MTKFRGIVIDQGKWIQWAVEEVGFNKMAEIVGVSRAVIDKEEDAIKSAKTMGVLVTKVEVGKKQEETK